MPPPVWVLLHSPLVGPATWTGVADALRKDDPTRRVIVPDAMGGPAAPPVRLGQGEVDTVVGTVVEATIAAKAASFPARSGPARQASAAYQ